MAITLDGLRKFIKTSIHGKRLGLDATERLVGPKGLRLAVTNATSASTGTQLPNYGHITLTSSNAREWQIADPVAGGEVSLSVVSTGSALMTVTPANATFVTSESSTGASMILKNGGTGVTLIGLSTALYGTRSASPGSTYIDFST